MSLNPSDAPRDRLPILVVILALTIFLPGMGWGIPHANSAERTHAWGNDDEVPLAPLAEMYNTFIAAQPGRNFAYPWFHYFLVASADTPYFAYLYAKGELRHPGGAYPFGLADPVTAFVNLTWIGRAVSMVLGLAVVLGAYYAGRSLWGRRAGLLSGVFAMLLFPVAYYAKLGNLDVPVLGWTSLGLAVCALCLRQGLTVRRGIYLGAFVALAAASKDQSVGSFMFLVPTLLLLQAWTGMPDRLWGWTSKLAGLAAATLAFVLVYVMASGIPVDPGRYKEHVMHTFELGTTTTGPLLRYPATFAGYIAQGKDLSGYLVDVMSWPLLIAAGVGIALALRRDRRSLLLLLSPLGLFLILIPVRFCKIHYLIPVALPLTFFAAYAFEQGLRARREIRLFAGAAAAGVAVLMLLQIVDLTHDMLHDSRYAAGIWLDQNTHRGDRIIDFAPDMRNPALRADIHLIKVDRRELSLSTIEEAQPEFLLIIPDDTDQDRNRVEWRYGPHAIHSDYLSEEAYGKLVDG